MKLNHLFVMLITVLLFTGCGSAPQPALGEGGTPAVPLDLSASGETGSEGSSLDGTGVMTFREGEDPFDTLEEILCRLKLLDPLHNNLHLWNTESYFLVNFGDDNFSNYNDYFLYQKDTEELIDLNQIATSLLYPNYNSSWKSVVNSTRLCNDNAIVFPYSGGCFFPVTDFPSKVLYHIPTKTYRKEYEILSGDSMPHFFHIGLDSDAALWKVHEITKSNRSFFLQFDILEMLHDTDYYYPEMLLTSTSFNEVSLLIKRCEMDSDFLEGFQMEGIEALSANPIFTDGQPGVLICFKMHPGYHLFGKIQIGGIRGGERRPGIGMPTMFYIQKDKMIHENYTQDFDLAQYFSLEEFAQFTEQGG